MGRPRLAQAGGRCLQCWWVTCGPEFSALPSLWAPWDQLGKPGSPQDGEAEPSPAVTCWTDLNSFLARQAFLERLNSYSCIFRILISLGLGRLYQTSNPGSSRKGECGPVFIF